MSRVTSRLTLENAGDVLSTRTWFACRVGQTPEGV